MSKSWVDRLTSWNVESLFSRKPSPKIKRSIYVNEPLPNDYFDRKGRVKKEHVYNTNQVLTSKYTIFTFLPRNLLEQFRRVANVCVGAIPSLLLLKNSHQYPSESFWLSTFFSSFLSLPQFRQAWSSFLSSSYWASRRPRTAMKISSVIRQTAVLTTLQR